MSFISGAVVGWLYMAILWRVALISLWISRADQRLQELEGRTNDNG